MKHMSLSALAAVGVLAGMTAANAADLGGNCCADLEERIAELEATTARKGNRKVSLTVSGWVSQQVTVWDDGVRTKAYVGDIGATISSNVRFTGSAQINSDWSAGYVLHLEARGNEPLAHDNSNVSQDGGVQTLQSFWFVKSNSLGKLSVGKQSSAGDNVAILPDGSGSLLQSLYVLYENNGFNIRNSAGGLTNQHWGDLATCPGLQLGVAADCDGVPNNNVRYDTPVFGGFSASASWGESDIWAVAGRYAGEHSGFKLSGAIGYVETTNTTTSITNPAYPGYFGGGPGLRVSGGSLQLGGYIEHVATGLFFYGAYGKDYNTRVSSWSGKPDGDNFYLKAGIRQKWSPLGHTVLYGLYGENNNKQSIADWDAGITSSNISQWSLGIVQEIDAAAMSMWFVYNNFSASVNCDATRNNGSNEGGCASGYGAGKGLTLGGGRTNFDDFQSFKAGALINF